VCTAKEQRRKRLAFFRSSVVVSPESSSYYPPSLDRETGAYALSQYGMKSPPKLSKETALLSSPDSSPCLPPPLKKAKPLSFSDESPTSSQTSTAKPDVVDFKAVQQRVQFLAEAFPEIPRQVTEQFSYLYWRCISN